MTYNAIGKSTDRIDAVDKVTGKTLYPGDRSYDTNALWIKVLFARRPHALVLSIDTSKAEAVEGVAMVLTAKDVPVNEYGLQIKDQPVLCGPGSGREGTDVVRFVGDQVAMVVAETEEIAAHARDLIEVEYEDLPVLTDPREAMKPGALQLHPDKPGNLTYKYRILKGDVDAAWSECDVIVEGSYETPPQEHVYLQPEAGSAYVDEKGRVTVHSAGQWTYVDREAIAHSLGLEVEKVRVVYDAIGGAFGGREDISVQIILGLAAMKLHEAGIDRPVRAIWSREESIIGHGKRHPMYIKAKWGAKKDGTLVAVEMDITADGGAYCYTSNKVLGNATFTCAGPYEVPNARINTRAIYTNNVPGAAFRGFGGPQGHFAAESQMNRLAEKLGMDPVEIRMKNLLREDSLIITGTKLTGGGVSLVEVVEKAALAAGWRRTDSGWRAPEKQKTGAPVVAGVGFAAGYKNIGFSMGYQENSHARVEIVGTKRVEGARLYIGGADCGQGHHTAMAQIAAEVLGVEAKDVQVIPSDTDTSGDPGSASASRLTYMAGNAVKGAAEKAMQAWKGEERPAIGDYKYLAPKTEYMYDDGTPSKPNVAYGYVAQAVLLEVDTETGEIRVRRFISADDVGKAINPLQVEGQIEGAVVQALGYSILESFKTSEGRVLTADMGTYLIPGVLDVPDEVVSIIVEDPEENGPFGVRGMGEMPYLAVAPAVIAAVHDATGVWFYDFPLTPERVLEGLGKI